MRRRHPTIASVSDSGVQATEAGKNDGHLHLAWAFTRNSLHR